MIVLSSEVYASYIGSHYQVYERSNTSHTYYRSARILFPELSLPNGIVSCSWYYLARKSHFSEIKLVCDRRSGGEIDDG